MKKQLLEIGKWIAVILVFAVVLAVIAALIYACYFSFTMIFEGVALGNWYYIAGGTIILLLIFK